MKEKKTQQKVGVLSELIGEVTPAKRAGLIYTVAACALFLVSFVVGALPVAEGETPTWLLYVSFLTSSIAFLITAIWYFSYIKTPIKEVLQEQKCHPKYYLIALMLQLVLFSVSELNGWVLKALNGLGFQETPIVLPSLDGFGVIGVLLTVALLPALMEEFIFRGIFLRETKEFSTLVRVVLCGCLFALYHQDPTQTVYQFICGASFAFVAIKAGSFLPTVVAHFVNNAVIILLYKFEIYALTLPMYVIILSVSAICLIGLIVYFLRFDRVTKSENGARKGAIKELLACASIGILMLGLSWLAVLSIGFSGG